MQQHPFVRSNRFMISGLIALLSSLFGQAYAYSVKDLQWDGKKPSPPLVINKKEIEKDINLLMYALEHAYGGKGFIDLVIFQSALTGLQAIKKDCNTLPVTTFCELIDTELFKIPDSHLMVKCTEEVAGGRKTVYRMLTEKTRSSRVGKNKNVGSLPWMVTVKEINHKRILVIAITHYPPSESPLWGNFLQKVETELPHIDGIILDVRGNRGGDDTMARKLATKVYGYIPFPHPVKAIYVNNSPEAYVVLKNSIQADIMQCVQKQKETKDADERMKWGICCKSLERFCEELGQSMALARKKGAPPYIKRLLGLPKDRGQKPVFDKPIAILIDSQTGSSGETTVDYFEYYPKVTTVGQQTVGVVHFGNVGFFVLPHSKLVVYMGTQFKKYRDNRFVERVGIRPYLEVEDGRDAFTIALDLLTKS